ncbi:MAG: hypothetical protein WC184_02080 [Acidimicrobiia bacterium]
MNHRTYVQADWIPTTQGGRLRRARTFQVVAITIGVLVGACGIGDSSERVAPPVESTATQSTEPDYGSMCVALDAALAGNVDVARSAFDHGPLHVLADEAVQIDRGVAAELLRAKEAVESDLADDSTPIATIAEDLRVLVAATDAARATTAGSSTPVCEQETP